MMPYRWLRLISIKELTLSHRNPDVNCIADFYIRHNWKHSCGLKSLAFQPGSFSVEAIDHPNLGLLIHAIIHMAKPILASIRLDGSGTQPVETS